jgi:predicted XRE-type DNA-binding protein
MKQNENIAVLTCDIIESSLLSSDELKEYQRIIESFADERILILPQFYRGDSFQLATKPADALEIAVRIRIEMKRLHEKNDVRISVGIGQVSILNENVLFSTGSAFEISGKNLDQLKNRKLNLLIQTEDSQLNDELETYCYFADAVINGMTKIQSNIIFYKLQGLGQNEIAEILDVSQPAVSKSLKTANWQTIERFLKRYKTMINQNYESND